MTLTAEKLSRMSKLARMLEGEHEGEVLTAARMITRMLREEGMNFADLVEKAFSAPVVQPQPAQPAPGSYNPPNYAPNQKRYTTFRGYKAYDVIAFSLARDQLLSEWDHNFLTSLKYLGPKAALTERQWEVLLAIGRKTGAIPRAA